MNSPVQVAPALRGALAPTDDRDTPPGAGTLRVLVRAGDDPERTRRTLSSLEGAAAVDSRPVDVWIVRPDGSAAPRGRGSRPLACCRPGDALVLLEDGAVVPAHWSRIVAAHVAAEPPWAVLAATSNYASGPERIESSASARGRRLTPEAWQGVAGAAESRWRTVREDMECVSSPLLVVARPLEFAPRLAEWWSGDPRVALVLEANERLVLARDLAVWREPGRGLARLAAEVRDPLAAAEHLSPPSLVRRAEALIRSCDSPRLHVHLAQCLVRLGDYARAAEHARACLRAWPQNVEARLWLGEALTRSGDRARARRALAELQQELPLAPRRKAHLLACMGELWRLEGDANQAEQCLEAALALDPHQPLALDSRGLLQLEAGDFDDSLRAFRRAVRSDPYYAAAWSDYGRALAMSGELERARTALGRALALRPTDRESRQLLVRLSGDD